MIFFLFLCIISKSFHLHYDKQCTVYKLKIYKLTNYNFIIFIIDYEIEFYNRGRNNSHELRRTLRMT